MVKLLYPPPDSAPFVESTPAYVAETQAKVDVKLRQRIVPDSDFEVDSIFACLKDYSDEEIDYALGRMGHYLRNFAESINIDHPSIRDINGGTLMYGGKVYNRFLESLELCKYAKKKEYTSIAGELKRFINRNHERILRVFQKPHIRLLKDDAERIRNRESYGTDREISYKSEVSVGKDSFSMMPYVRLGFDSDSRLDCLERAKKRLLDLGLSYESSNVDKQLRELQKEADSAYCGFYRITPSKAAFVLGSLMGCYPGSSPGQVGDTLHAPSAIFSKVFWKKAAKSLESDPLVSDVYDRRVTIEHVYRTAAGELLKYSPRIYPMHKFDGKRTPYVKQLLEYLDHYPDMNGCALFDQFWVIVPSVSWPSDRDGLFSYYENGRQYKYSKYKLFRAAVDAYLTNTKQIYPIIVGENVSNHSTYFISFWV